MTDDGLRKRKKARTRDALQAAALRLFAERGFAATTVEDVAAAAEVSPRTFFRYFATKEDVVFGDWEEQLRVWEAALLDGPAGETLGDALRRATLVVARHSLELTGSFEVRFRLLVAEPVLARRQLEFEGLAQRYAAEVLARVLGVDVAADVRPTLLAATAMGAVFAATRAWYLDGGDGSLEDRVLEAYDLLEGLGELLARPVEAT